VFAIANMYNDCKHLASVRIASNVTAVLTECGAVGTDSGAREGDSGRFVKAFGDKSHLRHDPHTVGSGGA